MSGNIAPTRSDREILRSRASCRNATAVNCFVSDPIGYRLDAAKGLDADIDLFPSKITPRTYERPASLNMTRLAQLAASESADIGMVFVHAASASASALATATVNRLTHQFDQGAPSRAIDAEP